DGGDVVSSRGQFGAELEQEARLPDAWLARHQGEACRPALDVAPELLEPGGRVSAGDEGGERSGLEAVPGPAALHHAKGRHWTSDALQGEGPERLQFEEARDQLGRLTADHDLA